MNLLKPIGQKTRTSFTLNLQTKDLMKLFDLTNKYNLTITELLERFISDLADGKRCRGNNEHESARAYLETFRERDDFFGYMMRNHELTLEDHDYDIDHYYSYLCYEEFIYPCFEEYISIKGLKTKYEGLSIAEKLEIAKEIPREIRKRLKKLERRLER